MYRKERSALKQEAGAALKGAPKEKQLIGVYLGVTIAISVAILILDIVLSKAVAGTGGLSNLGTRTVLETIQVALPLGQMLFTLCWDMGYLQGILNIIRGKHADGRTLREGFRFFGPALRLNLLLGLIYGGMAILSLYAGSMLISFTPFAKPLMDVMLEMGVDTAITPELLMSEEVMAATMQVMPYTVAAALLLFALVALPAYYRYRMASFCLLEQARPGALSAMAKSARMTFRSRMELFRLDLSLWWYYLLQVLVVAICYGSEILAALGVQLPFPAEVGDYLFYGLYTAAFFAVNYSLRNYREAVFTKAYQRLCPPEPPTNGVVLGNIFQA